MQERADGIVETQLALGQPKTDSFRQYTLIVENHIGVSKTEVELIQSKISKMTSTQDNWSWFSRA